MLEKIRIVALILMVISLIVSIISNFFQRKRFRKENSVCPKCGGHLIQELSSKEVDGPFTGMIYSTQVTQYYYILYCNKCGYSIEIDDIIEKSKKDKKCKINRKNTDGTNT